MATARLVRSLVEDYDWCVRGGYFGDTAEDFCDFVEGFLRYEAHLQRRILAASMEAPDDRAKGL